MIYILDRGRYSRITKESKKEKRNENLQSPSDVFEVKQLEVEKTLLLEKNLE